MNKIKIGISACLLGEKVRYNGGHTQDRFITDTLSEFFEYQPFCPEVAIGLGVPRETMRLVKTDQGIRSIMPKTGGDYTEQLSAYADEVIPTLDQISGYVLKSKSPSCGMERVKVYDEKGMPSDVKGVGIYAERLQEKMPDLPIEEEGRLHDPLLKENFIKRVFVYHEWQTLVADGITADALIKFHARHKMILILHHYGESKDLGRIIAGVTDDTAPEIADEYIAGVMQTLKRMATRRHHGQVLTRIVGTINKQLDEAQKRDILDMINEYTAGELPLSAPVRLIRHYLTAIDDPYIANQSYLQPYPDSLGLMKSL